MSRAEISAQAELTALQQTERYNRPWNSLPKSDKQAWMVSLRAIERKYGVTLAGNYNGTK